MLRVNCSIPCDADTEEHRVQRRAHRRAGRARGSPAGLTRGISATAPDMLGRRARSCASDTLMSALARPMMAVIVAPLWVFGAHLDRLGKGVRTAARMRC